MVITRGRWSSASTSMLSVSVCHRAITCAWQCCGSNRVLVVRRTRPQEPTFSKAVTELLQLCVFCLCFEKDRNVGIGVFPEGEKILVGGARFGCVALHRVATTQLEMSQRTDGFIGHDPAMVEDFLKLCCRFAALTRGKIGFSSYIDRIQVGAVV